MIKTNARNRYRTCFLQITGRIPPRHSVRREPAVERMFVHPLTTPEESYGKTSETESHPESEGFEPDLPQTKNKRHTVLIVEDNIELQNEIRKHWNNGIRYILPATERKRWKNLKRMMPQTLSSATS